MAMSRSLLLHPADEPGKSFDDQQPLEEEPLLPLLGRLAPAWSTPKRIDARRHSLKHADTVVGANVDSDPDTAVVQFTAAVYYGDMAEGEMQVDLCRIGPRGNRVSVDFSTHDGSAVAGREYVERSGTLEFEPYEYTKSITIPFIRNGLWSATTEFEIRLSNPELCFLGAYLYKCRVRVIDDDCFPSNEFEAAVRSKDLSKVSGFKLFVAYCKWNIFSCGLVWMTLVSLIFDQMRNIYELTLIYCDMYLVNVLCDPDHMELTMDQKVAGGYMIAAIHVFPWSILLLWDYAKARMDIKGRSVLCIQKHMYRKYMNFSTEVLEEIPAETLEYSLQTDAYTVSGGFTAFIGLFREVVSLLLNIYFVFTTRHRALPFLAMVVVSITAWGWIRSCYNVPSMRKEATAVAHLVKETVEDRDLIAAFMVRPHMNSWFVKEAEALRTKARTKELHDLTTRTFLRIAAPLVVCVYIITTIRALLEGEVSLGAFLAVIKILHKIAHETTVAHDQLSEVFLCFPSVTNLTIFCNRETEERSLRDLNRSRRKRTQDTLSEMGDADIDRLPVFCKDLSYTIQGSCILEDVSIQMPQGCVIAVHGPNGSGKNMLLKILAQQLQPSSGDIFLPSHLRTLVVSRMPMFLDRCLLNNLCIGQSGSFKDSDLPRLKEILESLKLQRLIPVLDAELADPERRAGKDRWSRSLSTAEKGRTSLARAFFMNPEFLCLQTPLAAFDGSMTETVERLFQDHCINRGLGFPESSAKQRRPRSIIFSADTKNDCRCANLVLEMVPTNHKNKDDEEIFSVRVPAV